MGAANHMKGWEPLV